MNVNSPQRMPVIKDWLFSANKELSDVGISSSMIDAELILSFALKVYRTYLHAHSIDIIDTKLLNSANKMLNSRLNRMPIAYILGYKEFYGRKFIVTQSTLIPRPESEDIIEMLKKYLPPTAYHLPSTKLIDVGTGTGCLGITAKLELPGLDVTLIDIDSSALSVAKNNANNLLTKVNIIKSDLLKNHKGIADIIIANLPYVDESWDRSPETKYEPDFALFAKDGGLYFIKKLIDQASDIQTLGNIVILEADPCQHSDIIRYAKKLNYICEDKCRYILLFKKCK